MNIEELRKIRNKDVKTQNIIAYHDMKCISDEFRTSYQKFKWLNEVLSSFRLSCSNGIFIKYHEILEQYGVLKSGTWLDSEKRFYDFEVMVDVRTNEVQEIDSWQEVFPEINEHKKGVGKTHAYIALELLSTYEKS